VFWCETVQSCRLMATHCISIPAGVVRTSLLLGIRGDYFFSLTKSGPVEFLYYTTMTAYCQICWWLGHDNVGKQNPCIQPRGEMKLIPASVYVTLKLVLIGLGYYFVCHSYVTLPFGCKPPGNSLKPHGSLDCLPSDEKCKWVIFRGCVLPQQEYKYRFALWYWVRRVLVQRQIRVWGPAMCCQ
jgi:hypothetical protein